MLETLVRYQDGWQSAGDSHQFEAAAFGDAKIIWTSVHGEQCIVIQMRGKLMTTVRVNGFRLEK